MNNIYVDHAATTPLHPQVLEKMQVYLSNQFGNPSSIHHFGRKARAVMDEARDELATLLGTVADDLILTSGGTEADNLAVLGVALSNQEKGKHILTTQIEHHAVLHTCQYLERLGFEVTYLPVNRVGQVEVQVVEENLREDTILASIMYCNNEVGTIQPIEQIGTLLRTKGILFHTDAVQALGMREINLAELPVDLLSLSSHKINGPQGVGLLYSRKSVPLQPLFHGGTQERKRRAGTENIAGLLGFAEALKLAYDDVSVRQERYKSFKEKIIQILEAEEVNYYVNGGLSEHTSAFSIEHIFNLSFPDVPADLMLMNLDLEGIAASSGSACTAGSLQPSHVLQAMYPTEKERIHSAIRFSFGWGNTMEEVEQVAYTIAKIVHRLKNR